VVAPVDFLQPIDGGGRIGEGFDGYPLRVQGIPRGSHARSLFSALRIDLQGPPMSSAQSSRYESDGSRDFVNRPWRDYTGL
jgi:hypothetical protein